MMYDAEVREKGEVERHIWESREAWWRVVGEEKGAPAQKGWLEEGGLPDETGCLLWFGKISDLRDTHEARCLSRLFDEPQSTCFNGPGPAFRQNDGGGVEVKGA